MDCLVAIGTGIVSKIAEYTVAPVVRQVGYLIHYNRNLETLESQLGYLDAEKQSAEHRVGEENRNIREPAAPVKKWLTDVQKITGEANDILKEDNKAKMKCLNGFCPNLMLRYQLSRKSTKLVHDIAELNGKKDFNTFAHATTPQDVPTKGYEAFGSRTLVVKQIMDVLRNDPNTDIIGVYGLGGVGKTTFVKEVSRQATELFDDVAMVLDVKQNPSIKRIQKEIADKLGLDLPGDETTAARVRRLFTRIKDQQTLVILDDVWERIDLEAVGISSVATCRERIDLEDVGIASVATCKVLLTSRTRDVLSREMHTQKEFELKVLEEEEPWRLFEKMAGDVIKDPAIRTVAIQVAERCGGLPVMVVTVASALKNRSRLHAWNDALRRLKRFEREELTEKTYLALEWSYSQLNDEELKPLFLLCGLFVGQSNNVYILDLLKYSIGLGLLRTIATMGAAWDALNSRLERLKDACLLQEYDYDNGYVKMHDLVHDVAKRISSKDQHVLKVAHGDELKEWADNKELFEKCTMISLRTSNIPKLPEVFQCKELKLFHVLPSVDDYSLEIPCDFFKETAKLRVLDLTSLSIPSLPQSLQFLKNLQTLCLDHCTLGDIALVGQLQNLEILSVLKSKFKQLPKEIGKLTRLRLLDLTGCSQLEVISPNVISSLTRLEVLKMGNSFNRWEAEGVISSERNNASLLELKHLPQLSALQIHILDANILPADLFSNALERYQIYIGASWEWDHANKTLNTLKLKLTTGNELNQSGVTLLLKKTDELYLDGMEAAWKSNACQLDGESFQQLKHLHVRNAEFKQIINGKGVLPNLTRLVVSDIDGLRSLLSSAMARSLVHLTHLEISRCRILEDVVSTTVSDEENMENVFSKLQHLGLKSLPNLTKFCSKSPTKFPSLEILQLNDIKEIEEMDSKENLEHMVEYCLFDKKLRFPSLERLLINGLKKLMTIWHSQLSPESFKNLVFVDIRSCESLKNVFPSSLIRSLQQLMYLTVVDCRVEVIIVSEEGLQPTPKFVFSKMDVFSNLILLVVSDIDGLRSLLSSSMARSLVKLIHLQISGCPNLEEIISTNVSDEENMENVFSKLQHLELKGLPNLTRFCSKSSTEFPPLEILPLDNIKEIDKIDSKENPEHKIEHCLFDKKLRFPSLKRLIINGLTKLMAIWHSQLSPESFKNLESVDIQSCVSLKNVFPYSLIRSLQQLMELNVVSCGVEVITAREEGLQTPPKFVFSQVKKVNFNMLPQLGSFYPGIHVSSWPSLMHIIVHECDKVEIFAEEFSNFQERESANHTPPIKQTLFLIEKDSFPNLEQLAIFGMEIWDGPFPAKFFSKLEFLGFSNPHSKSTTVLEKFLDLEKLNVTSALSDQTSFHEGNSSGNIPAVGNLPHLRTLFLMNMMKLMHLGEDSSQQAGQSFPNLEVLSLTHCYSLKNLRSSAISFENLTTLEVQNCSALEYLIADSTAKSVMQLTKLEVENCVTLTAIVGSNGDDSGHPIAFSRLKHLKLSHLPRMRGFCSGNCTVRFPSLETLSMSNRLKSKIYHQFHVDERLQITNQSGDTDVDVDDGEIVTKENDEVDVGASG